MNIKELMCGDWVCITSLSDENKKKYGRISAIFNDNRDEPYAVVTDEQSETILCKEELLEPIKLDVPRLFYNGFRSFPCPKGEMFFKETDKEISHTGCVYIKGYIIRMFNGMDICWNSDVWGDGTDRVLVHTSKVPQYVHELQHALQLCGLTELNEKFEVI